MTRRAYLFLISVLLVSCLDEEALLDSGAPSVPVIHSFFEPDSTLKVYIDASRTNEGFFNPDDQKLKNPDKVFVTVKNFAGFREGFYELYGKKEGEVTLFSNPDLKGKAGLHYEMNVSYNSEDDNSTEFIYAENHIPKDTAKVLSASLEKYGYDSHKLKLSIEDDLQQEKYYFIKLSLNPTIVDYLPDSTPITYKVFMTLDYDEISIPRNKHGIILKNDFFNNSTVDLTSIIDIEYGNGVPLWLNWDIALLEVRIITKEYYEYVESIILQQREDFIGEYSRIKSNLLSSDDSKKALGVFAGSNVVYIKPEVIE